MTPRTWSSTTMGSTIRALGTACPSPEEMVT